MFKISKVYTTRCKNLGIIIFEFVAKTQSLFLTPDCESMQAAAYSKFKNKYLFCREKFENAKIMHFVLFIESQLLKCA